jgi:uncharacterized protein
MKIVIPGGSGHVGQSLERFFRAKGDEVVIISRSKGVKWDGKTLGDWVTALEGADLIINLTGRSVNCRYTPENFAEMHASRIDSTRVLGEAIGRFEQKPKLWINASTATIYDHRLDAANDDETGHIGVNATPAPTKWKNSVRLAHDWEAAFFEAETPGVRKVAIRSAMVMAPIRASIFSVLTGLTKKGLMGAQGSGKQYLSWIHERDFCEAMQWIFDHNAIQGSLIVAAPNPLPQAEFARIMRRRLGVKIGLPATAWMLELGAIALKTETELLLKSRRVVPSKLLASGFEFAFPSWDEACADLVASPMQ